MDETNIPRKLPEYSLERFAERFWSKVNRDGQIPKHRPELGPCWEWTAYINRSGYGEVGRSRPRRVETVHRVAWELVTGAPAGELCVLHRCDNPRCVCPDHLFLGTRTDNMTDKVAKGRQQRGEKTWSAKLTEGQVVYIRERRARGVPSHAIAKAIGVCRETVDAAVRGKTWAHVK